MQAVGTIHDERIVHSDLKPANFIFVQGQLKLLDFGIAKNMQADTTSIVRENQVTPLLLHPRDDASVFSAPVQTSFGISSSYSC